ncbi:MAG: hypothetical protein IE885_05230 [Campylobacterales bacterium]|nr:hypothetical protein [Campylobacterales bacterium]
MHILLVNTNPVVSRLISLCMRHPQIIFEEVEQIDEAQNKMYDVVFIDDDSYTEELEKKIATWQIGKKVLFSRKKEVNDFFDEVVQKPFLPSHIILLLERYRSEEKNNIQKKDHAIFPLTTGEEQNVDASRSEENKTQILDDREIRKIKELLEMDEDAGEWFDSENVDEEKKIAIIKEQLIKDGLEIVEEEEFFDLLRNEANEAKQTVLHVDSDKKEEKPRSTFEETLLEAITGMKVKKIRKLLQGAEVSITIRFKDDA